MNPFAAPQYDSPPPAVSVGHRLLSVLGLFEMVAGAGLAVFFTVLCVMHGVEQAKGRPFYWVGALVALGLLLGLCALCVTAGYKLTRRSSWKPLLLQLVPALMTVLFVLGRVLGWG